MAYLDISNHRPSSEVVAYDINVYFTLIACGSNVILSFLLSNKTEAVIVVLHGSTCNSEFKADNVAVTDALTKYESKILNHTSLFIFIFFND